MAENSSGAGLVLYRALDLLPDTTFYGQSPNSHMKTGEALDAVFDTDRFNLVQISVAWIRRTGVQAIAQRLEQFLSHSPDNWVNITFGCGFGGTSSEAIRELLEIGRRNVGLLRLRANLQSNGTFHPKIYFAQHTNTEKMVVAIGSSNLTGAALSGNNSEALLLLDTDDHGDRKPFYEIEDYIDNCNDDSLQEVIEIRNLQGVQELMKAGFLSSEKKLRNRAARTSNRSKRGRKRISALRAKLGLPDLSGSTSGGSGSGSGGGSGGGSGSGSGGGSGGGTGGSAGFASATRLEMLLQNDGGRIGSPYVKIPTVASSFFPATAPGPRAYDDCHISIEFVDRAGTTFTPAPRRWWFRPTGEWSLETGSEARRRLDWPDRGIMVVTRLTGPSPAYRIEVIQPTDSSYSTRYSALDSTARKMVTAFP